MSVTTQYLKERDSIAGTPIYPQTLNGANAQTGTVDMSKFYKVQFLLGTGFCTASSSIQFVLQQGNNANGSDAVNIANTAITNTALTNTENTSEIAANQLTGRYVRGWVAENGSKVVTLCVYPIASEPRYPPQASDDASVNQRVANFT